MLLGDSVPDENSQGLAAQVDQLTDELEAALIERDKYRSATVTMAQALQQMDDLLKESPAKQGDDWCD